MIHPPLAFGFFHYPRSQRAAAEDSGARAHGGSATSPRERRFLRAKAIF
jgi:hypothetical protein